MPARSWLEKKAAYTALTLILSGDTVAEILCRESLHISSIWVRFACRRSTRKKYFKGPKAGEYSCNPLGKNPGDVWVIPNVKSNHVEKTGHPCQFPVELIERLVLPLTKEGDWVFDPFLGTGTSIIAAIRHERRGAGAENVPKYVWLAKTRIKQAVEGTLPVRPMSRPVFDPRDAGRALTTAPWLVPKDENGHLLLGERKGRYRARVKARA